MKKLLLFVFLSCLILETIHAEIIIPADVSCRTEGADRAGDNRSDSSKLSVRASSNGNKSWIKFDLGDLDVSNLASATITVSLHEGKSGDQSCDVSCVNDDVLDNIDWEEKTITWNNAPGNNTADLGLLDPEKTTLLGTITFIDGIAGDSFDIDALAAIESDTDGIVQFVLHNSSSLLNFSTHDHSVVEQRPILTIVERHDGANDPVPDGLTSVETSLAMLSWTNPDPNDPNDPGTAITCDVYLGTEPNRPQMDMVSLGAGESTVDINTDNFPNFGVLINKTQYYWFVDCYDSTAGTGNEAKPGLLWSFFVDDNQPPVVVLEELMVTWLGRSGTPETETIELVPIEVSDDGLPSDSTSAMWTQVDNGAPTADIDAVEQETTNVSFTERGVYEFMLTVSDGVKESSDTIEVVVGADPCDASHMSTGDPYNDADTNQDCIVDLDDFAEFISANWLDCTDAITDCSN